jgi:thiamine pyrophosphokinase
MSCVIVAGGSVEDALVEQFARAADCIIAADRGLEALERVGIRPHIIVGDFDSASAACVSHVADYEAQGVQVVRLIPEKDDTDTEAALQLAFNQSEGDIVILGGTGSRLDHVLGNISILGQGLSRGRQVFLLDSHNRIRLIDSDLTVAREELYGPYISLFPYGNQVEGVTLEGFKYPLVHATMEGFTSLGVSNEVTAQVGKIHLEHGVLIVIEAKE